MRIDIIGGGPAGLYFAILAKKSFPRASIDVVERHAADDTFGFGIVLSDETLANLKRADEPSYREIAARFAYWDDIYVHFKGDVRKSSGHGFSGIQRLALLRILQRRAEALGVRIRFLTEDAGIASHRDADLVVAADGVGSAVRETWKDHFRPSVDLRSNWFTWLGARMNLPGFFYSFREDERGGVWNMHAYQYTAPVPGPDEGPCGGAAQAESTIVIETTDAAWRASGLAVDDEAATAAFVERLFRDELNGARVLTNRSVWRRFPTISLATWWRRQGRAHVVLLGDAAHTAHYSIGSGTKLALEDAIGLHAAVSAHPRDLGAALRTYEATRRDEVGRIQHSANVSLAWFENVRRFWAMAPWQFNAGLLTRSKQITYENLRLRDAALVADITAAWNTGEAARLGIRPPASLQTPPMFAPLKLRGLWIPNRVVVSPMAQYSAVDGMPNDWHFVHYAERAKGGAGLVFVEMTCVSPEARITPGCTGLYTQAHADAWKRLVEFVHANTAARIALQLGHAGRKGSTQIGWRRIDWPLEDEPNWPLVSASPIPYRAGINAVPREASRKDMVELIGQFRRSAKLADRAGFDLLELHMAHGYLLASFLSPVTNRRTDEYGGALENRLRFPLELFRAVRAIWPEEKPMSVRLSATDWMAGGNTGDDAVAIAAAFKAAGCDLIDVSSGQTDPASAPVYGRMYQAAFAEQVRLEAGIATLAVGAVTTADQINTLLVSGRADLVALARPHLADPYFTLHAAAEHGFDGIGWPSQYLPGAQQLYTTARRAREDAARKLDGLKTAQ